MIPEIEKPLSQHEGGCASRPRIDIMLEVTCVAAGTNDKLAISPGMRIVSGMLRLRHVLQQVNDVAQRAECRRPVSLSQLFPVSLLDPPDIRRKIGSCVGKDESSGLDSLNLLASRILLSTKPGGNCGDASRKTVAPGVRSTYRAPRSGDKRSMPNRMKRSDTAGLSQDRR